MNILILHRIPYGKIQYHRGIDHARHEVTYIGTRDALETIPTGLRCKKITRPGHGDPAEAVIAALRGRPEQYDRVISLSEYELMAAAIVREKLGVAGTSVESTALVRDKLKMKAAVSRQGLRVPRNLSLREWHSRELQWHGKTVLKPIDGASSENVIIFDSADQLRDALRSKTTGIHCVDVGDYAGYQVEEFIEGDILHFDGLVAAGELQLCVSSKYIGNCLAYAQGRPLGSVQIPLLESYESWVRSALTATRIRNGSFHLEAITSGDELIFLEVANRVGGADVVDATELATGVHLPSQELRIYLGEAPNEIPVPKQEKRFGWFVFPGHSLKGDYCHIEDEAPYRHHEYVVRWNQLADSKALKKHITYQASEVPIAGLVGADSSEAVETFMRDMFDNVRLSAVAGILPAKCTA
jgi:hypothetical protein